MDKKILETAPDKQAQLYFLGIGGTGMAAVAGLLKEDGYKVFGSDKAIYPPMSDLLASQNITVFSPYAAENLRRAKADVVVVANAISRGHPELEYAIEQGLPLTSFPELLEKIYLSKKQSIVIAGTHGKTTTTSLVSHLLYAAGADPSFFIGGIPNNFPQSFRLGNSPYFVVEGDEYDTVFYDKGPKFLHYCPKYLVLGNIEYDHADIYASVEEIYERFAQVVELCWQSGGTVIANMDDAGVQTLLTRLAIKDHKLLRVGRGKNHKPGDAALDLKYEVQLLEDGGSLALQWHSSRQEIVMRTQLLGQHNQTNAAMALATLIAIHRDHGLPKLDLKNLSAPLASFRGVKRRLELLSSQGPMIYEDFAHHPTAVSQIIKTFRSHSPNRRLVVAFEPANASSRRNVFSDLYAEAFRSADLVFIGASPIDQRIAPDKRMDTSAIAQKAGKHCSAYASNDELLTQLHKETRPGDIVVFMSPSSFSGIQHKFADEINKKQGSSI
jgi:UDP-N-acetylmuramate: L-alanyl-gamma-D-glutamyl-meso-diaminopimelate ligase